MQDYAVPAFHVMAKPTGARCNLRCDYCFFLEKERLYPASDFRMSDAVMEAFVAQTAQAQQVPQVTVAWQGGEPTLMGLDFFRRARAAEKGRVPAGMAVERTLQTNGVLLDDEWCTWLVENDYLVGSASTARASCTTPTGMTKAGGRSSIASSQPPTACRSTARSSTCSAR